jgi:hypothetical protein
MAIMSGILFLKSVERIPTMDSDAMDVSKHDPTTGRQTKCGTNWPVGFRCVSTSTF